MEKPKFPILAVCIFSSLFLFGAIGLLTQPSIGRDENGTFRLTFHSPKELLKTTDIIPTK